MPYDANGDWYEDFTSGGYDSDFNYGADTGDLSTSDIGIGGASAGGDYSGYDWAKLGKSILDKANTPAGVAALTTLFAGLSGANKPSASPGWKGVINPNATVAKREKIAQPTYVPYSGKPVMGQKHFTDVEYTTKAAEGGLMGLAAGGRTKAPRYLEGATDGMADKISTSIDGNQPAALSHGEFVIPADVVSHLGNGNSKAGSEVLYKMMDRIRHARTGNKKQGKRINPEKFTPGGIASIAGYAGGGVVAFAGDGKAGSLVTTGQGTSTSMPVTSESNLSSWAGPGIADYIQKGTALAQSPYQAYTGPLTAGPSPLQQQAFTATGNLQPPAAMGQAAGLVGDAAAKMGNLSYTPQTATSTYSAPTAYSAGQVGNLYAGTDTYTPQAASSQFQAPGAYGAGSFNNQYVGTDAYTPQTTTNQFQGPAAYTAGSFTDKYTGVGPYKASDISTDKFNTAAMQQYMNPYLEMSLEPQLAEARRQSQITQMGNAAKLSQAGAYGGSRGALMDTETQRNLLQNLAGITGQGYNTAYNTALNAFNTQQGLGLQAQQANETSRQFGAGQALTNAQNVAKYGMDTQAAREASRQFGAGQAMTAAQNTAQYGQAAQALNAQERQFGAGQALANAQSKAQYGQAALSAGEASRQFGAGQAMTAAQQAAQSGQAAQALNAQQQQFGANQALTNAQNAAQYGLAGFSANEQARQTQASQAAQNAAQQAQYGQAAQALNAQQQQFGANLGLSGLQGQVSAGTALGGLGMQQGQLGLANLQQQLAAGTTQQGIEQQGIDALFKQYEQERLDPYKQVQFQQSLYQGLPVSTVTGSTATTQLQQIKDALSGAGGVYDQVNQNKP